MSYSPTEGDLNVLLEMLTNSASGNNSKQVNDQLMSFANNPNFSLLLCTVFAALSPCVSNQLPLDWTTYRAVGGLALKNAISNRKINLIESILVNSGQATIQVLCTESNPMLIRTAAQIYARITVRVGRIDWWATAVQSDMSQLLLNTLLKSPQPAQVKAALYSLQYLLEDSAAQIGEASEVIIASIASFAEGQPEAVRRHAFALICQVFELGTDVDWNVDTFTPMQMGLCKSSYRVAHFATQMAQTEARNDPILMRDVLSCFSTLLDYLEYFSDNLDVTAVATTWIDTAMNYVVNASDDQVTTAALDFIINVVSVYSRVEGEGPITHFEAVLRPRLGPLTQSLFPLMLMKDEEVQSHLQNDHYTIRDKNRQQSVIKRTFGDDATTNEEDTVLSVRRSASLCLDHLCRMGSDAVFPHILEVCLTKWEDPDWRFREVAILCLGAAVQGAYAQLDPYFNEFVPKIIDAISVGTNQHVCITSMAAWAAQRMSIWILTNGSAFVGRYVNALLGNFTCESKRVQAACVPALRMLIMTVPALGLDANVMAPYYSAIAETVKNCVPHYHTTNLKLLCDLAISVMYLAPSPIEQQQLVAPFHDAFADKFARLGQTFYAFYNDNGSNNQTVVETDVFDISRVLYKYLQDYPSAEMAFQHLGSWIDVLTTIATGGHTDDPELAEQPTRLCSILITALPSNALQAFSKLKELGNVVTWLLQYPSSSVQGAACALLGDMINGFGAQTFDVVSGDALVTALTPLINPDTDLDVLVDASRAVSAVVAAAPSANLSGLVGSLANCIRADVFGSTREGHCQLAFDLCGLLVVSPGAATAKSLCNIAELLYGSSNDYPKREATISFCALMPNPAIHNTLAQAGAVPTFLNMFMKMVFSWQKMSEGDCQRAISAALTVLMNGYNQQLWSVIQSNAPAYIQDIFGHYDIQV